VHMLKEMLIVIAQIYLVGIGIGTFLTLCLAIWIVIYLIKDKNEKRGK